MQWRPQVFFEFCIQVIFPADEANGIQGNIDKSQDDSLIPREISNLFGNFMVNLHVGKTENRA